MTAIRIAFILSVFIFLFGVSFTIYYIKKSRADAKKAIIGLITSTALAFFPLYFIDISPADGGLLDRIFRAFLGVARSMMGENSLDDTRIALIGATNGLSFAASIYTSFLHVVATLLLLGLLFSFFENFFPKIKYHLYPRASITVFSNISDRTILLAKDMKAQALAGKKRDGIFVFLDEGNQRSNIDPRYLKEIKILNAFIFNENVCALSLPRLFNINNVDYFLLQENETTNLNEAIELSKKWANPFKKYNDKKLDIRVHILNANPEAEQIVDSIEYNSRIKFRLIRETRTALYNLVNQHPLFLGAKNNQLTVLVIGAGRSGQEAIKTVAWCGQTLLIQPNILVVDSNPFVAQQFQKDCPELMKDRNCSIQFTTLDVTGNEYTEFLAIHPEVGYIICTLGDESLNVNTAMYTRGIYDKIRFSPENALYMQQPQIHIRVTQPFLHDVVSRMQFDARQNCHLNAFGSISELYTWENITGSYLDCIGIAINRFYELDFAKEELRGLSADIAKSRKQKIIIRADENYEKKEFNRGASIALGLHAKYKLYAALVEFLGNEQERYNWGQDPTLEIIDKVQSYMNTDLEENPLIEAISELEHRRWNHYMRTQGWQTTNLDQMDLWYDELGTKHRNFAAKLTPCLVDWDDLPTLDRELFERHPNQKTDFQMLDRIFVTNLPEILREANQIYNSVYKN